MQEHPVPQNVTGYEFHLIGQMTLKQFFTAGAGVLFAVLTNATNLPVIFKYPLVAIFFLGGAALAFLPYEGRPLDRWFFAFIKSIYRPTMFFWKKTQNVPAPFTYTQPRFLDTSPTVDFKGLRSSRVHEFLQTIPKSEVWEDKDFFSSDDKLAEIMALFSQTTTGNLQPPTVPSITKTAPRRTKNEESVSVFIQPPIPPSPPRSVEIKSQTEIVSPNHRSPDTASTSFAPPAPVKVESLIKPSRAGLNPVTTNLGLPFPKPPNKPNMVVGMVFSKDNKMLDGTIIEIVRQSDGIPVRALKTNALGQFAVITPLESGQYEIRIEKEGYSFDNASLILNNEVVPPILIQAKT